MKLLKDEQLNFLFNREIKLNRIECFPQWGFFVYKPNGEKEGFINVNPYTRSLYKEYFVISEIRNNICYGNFYNIKVFTDFGIHIDDLQKRDSLEIIFTSIFSIPYFLLVNTFNYFKTCVKRTSNN